MDYKELLKKYWFVLLITAVMVVFVGIYIGDTVKNKPVSVTNKTVDSKSVVYSVDGEYVYADDFYESLYTENGLQASFTQFQRTVMDKAVKTTDDMNTIASNYAAYVLQSYGQDYVVSALKSMGYVNGTDDLVQYYIDSQKQDLIVKEYLTSHLDEYVEPYIEENDPRLIYHILVLVDDITNETDENGEVVYTAHPNQEEQEKLDAILEALKTQSFEDVAKEYSDDSSSTNGGLIGVISNANKDNYYAVFAKESLRLASDEVSDVITSQSGYHIIWNKGNDALTLLEDTSFADTIANENSEIIVKALLEKAEEYNIEIVDEQLLEMLNVQLGSED